MTTPEMTIVDYGAGNLRSVQKAFEYLGYGARITSSPLDIINAQAIVFPGQGAAEPAMAGLRLHGLVEPLLESIQRGTPFLGVCLGLQLLMESSDEGKTACLGVFTGSVRRLPLGLKVPHMGWNKVHLRMDHPLFHGVPEDAHFYFVHSYYAELADNSVVAGTTEYGVKFCSVVTMGSMMATQFHPEKSGPVGLKLYKNFVQHVVQQEAIS